MTHTRQATRNRRHHRRRGAAMYELLTFFAVVLLIGIVTLVTGTIIVLLIGVAVSLAAVLAIGTLHTRRVYARPVPCRICDGVGLLGHLTEPGRPLRIEVCEVCMGNGKFAPSLSAAIKANGLVR